MHEEIRGGPVPRLVLPIGAALVFFAVAWPTAHVELGLGAATAMVAGLAAAAPVALAGVAPVAAWALSVLGAAIVGTVVDPPVRGLPVPTIHVVALLGLLLVVGVVGHRWVFAAATAGTAVVLLAVLAPAGTIPQVTLGLIMVLVVALLGRQVVRSRRALATQAELGAREREHRLILEERARIARDLHDVVAHSMSMVVVRAQTARYRVPDVSEAAAAEFAAVADTARDTLGEVRAVLGVLRAPDDDTLHTDAGTEIAADAADVPDGGRAAAVAGTDVRRRPQPGLADVDDLLETTSRAGVDLSVTRSGDAAGTTAAVAVSLYRILAEALANASRHASGAPVTVGIEHSPERVRVRVHNEPGDDVTGPGAGLGTPGMRERAAAVGGTLRIGPLDDGGWVVEATLPLARHLDGART